MGPLMPNKQFIMVVESQPDWSKAKCVGAPGEVFFPEIPFGGFIRSEHMREALRYCSVCPIKQECLEYACRTDSVGIWGGTYLSEHRARKLREKYGWHLHRQALTESE